MIPQFKDNSQSPLIQYLTILGQQKELKISKMVISLFEHLLSTEKDISVSLNADIAYKEKRRFNFNFLVISNAFSILAQKELEDVTQEEYELFMNRLFAKGMKLQDTKHYFIKEFDISLNEALNFDYANQIISHEAFCPQIISVDDDQYSYHQHYEQRQLFLLKQALKEFSSLDFIKHCEKYATLHYLVASNAYSNINFLLENNFQINTLDSSGKNALFFANNIKMLSFLDTHHINWLVTDNKGEDVLGQFLTLNNENKTNMVSYTKKRMKDNFNPLDIHFKKERDNKALLNLLLNNSLKKEIDSFIKQNNISSFDNIYDDENNTLLQICIKKRQWAKAYSFLNSPLNHKNNQNRTALGELLAINSKTTREKDTVNLLDLLWDKTLKTEHNFFEAALFNVVTSYGQNPPIWIHKDYEQFCKKVNPDSILYDNSIFSSSRFYGNMSTSGNSKTFFAITFLLECMKKNNTLSLNLFSFIDKILDVKDIVLKNELPSYYSFNKNQFSTFLFLLEALDENMKKSLHYFQLQYKIQGNSSQRIPSRKI